MLNNLKNLKNLKYFLKTGYFREKTIEKVHQRDIMARQNEASCGRLCQRWFHSFVRMCDDRRWYDACGGQGPTGGTQAGGDLGQVEQ